MRSRPKKMTRTDRPVFLKFARIRFPIGAIASIGHRVSGVILALAIPFAILSLQRALSGPAEFAAITEALHSVPGRIVAALLAWACAHHLCAGIRHLLTDVGVGASLSVSRVSAFSVLIAGGVTTLLALVI